MARVAHLEAIIRPAGCTGAGQSCRRVLVTGDGTDDRLAPDIPATCPRCGRPVSALIVVIAGVDVDLV